MRSPRSLLATALSVSLVAGALAVSAPAPMPVAAAGVTTENGCITSVPDPGTTAPVRICYTLFKPFGARPSSPVPLVFHSHGWAGSRTTDPAAFADFLSAGFGVLSFDQRGFGESGGKAHIMNPDVEGKDVQLLVDFVTPRRWIAKEAPGDPVLGAIGGSYGGGYQFVGAFSELRDRGATRFDVLAPEITWFDINESLAPRGVARTLWASLLYAAGTQSDANTTVVSESLLESVATSDWPPALRRFLNRNGPVWHVAQGRKLDIPVLLGQGANDNLFPLDQGLKNFQRSLTPRARARSILVGYEGGHTLPSVLPAGAPEAAELFTNIANGGLTGNDPCSRKLGGSTFRALSLRFFQEQLQGEATGLRGRGKYHLATVGGRCVTLTDTTASQSVDVADVISTVGFGVPQQIPLASGPMTLAGSPRLDAKVTSLALDGRVFLGLAVGTSPANAKIVQNNMLPLRQAGIDPRRRTGVELPSVAVDVKAGQTLYLTVSPISDMSFGHGSRVPGAITLDDVRVHLPVR